MFKKDLRDLLEKVKVWHIWSSSLPPTAIIYIYSIMIQWKNNDLSCDIKQIYL